MRIEPCRDGGCHAAGSFREDTLSLRKLMDSRHELHIRDVLGPATGLAAPSSRLRGTVRRIADGERAGDRVFGRCGSM